MATAMLFLAALGTAACSSSKPTPPAGAGVEAPVVAPDLAPDFRFRWPEPARARLTLRIGEGKDVLAMVSELTLEARDGKGQRHLRMTPWEGAGGRFDRMAAAMMQRHSEDGLVVDAEGSTVDEEAGLTWARWVETWRFFTDISEGEEQRVETGDTLPPGLELRATRRGTSPLHPNALELTYRLVAVSEQGHAALIEMLQLSPRQVSSRGAPKWVQFVGHIDPRTLQPLRVDMLTELEHRAGLTQLMSFEFDWVP